MSSRSHKPLSGLRIAITVAGSLVGAAVFGAVLASALTLSGGRARAPLQNPFDVSRSAQ